MGTGADLMRAVVLLRHRRQQFIPGTLSMIAALLAKGYQVDAWLLGDESGYLQTKISNISGLHIFTDPSPIWARVMDSVWLQQCLDSLLAKYQGQHYYLAMVDEPFARAVALRYTQLDAARKLQILASAEALPASGANQQQPLFCFPFAEGNKTALTEGPARIEIMDLGLQTAYKAAGDFKALESERRDMGFMLGYGIGSKEQCQKLVALASALGIELAATARVIEMGWLPKKYLVGMSARSLSLRWLFAWGCSGAIQNRWGWWQCQHVVAVNNDIEAVIMQEVDYIWHTSVEHAIAVLQHAISSPLQVQKEKIE
jgi:hypothetical protein